MKILSIILSATLLAGTCTVAMAQSAGADVNPNQMGRGADGNPSSMWANPMAGNRGNTMQARQRQRGQFGYGQRMRSSNVSGTWNNGENNRNWARGTWSSSAGAWNDSSSTPAWHRLAVKGDRYFLQGHEATRPDQPGRFRW